MTTNSVRWVALLVVALVLLVAAPAALADQPAPPSPVDPQTCALCHQSEVRDWSASPHAGAFHALSGHESITCTESGDSACDCLSCHTSGFDGVSSAPLSDGVTCEACHGPLVAGHPETGEMPLDVDSSVCSTCHADTHAQWATTPHGEAGVQCIGCHRSHTQDLRLDDQVLCESCHSERLKDSGHMAHAQAQVSCIDCHTSPAATAATALADNTMPSPNHLFSVDTASCESCHGERFHEDATGSAISDQTWNAAVSEAAGQTVAREIAAAESVAEASNRQWLQGATLVSFGLGIGFGGALGIIFVLIAGFFLQRMGRSQS
ncbi:MAG: multiheme c-type cytochrome [Caldilineales bacterium]